MHEPVASFHSELVRTAISNARMHGPRVEDLTLTLDTDPATLRRVVCWMYGVRENDDTCARAARAEMLRVANYMQMPELERECLASIEASAKFDLCASEATDDDVRQYAELWMMLSTISAPILAVQEALMAMLMRRGSRVVDSIVSSLSLDALRSLTSTRGSCIVFALELALVWRRGREHLDCHDLLGHVQFEAMPPRFVEDLAARDDLSREYVAQRLKCASLLSFTIGTVLDTTFGWAGLFDCRFGAVKLVAEPSAQEPWRLYVRPLGDIPTHCAMQHDVVSHTPQALVVDGRIFTFGLLAPRVRERASATGYVYSEFDSRWHPYGVVPRCMYEASFGAVVYGTSIYFVRMAGNRESASCVSFDVATCAWTVRPGMTFSRSWPCIAILDGLLYVIGGTPSAPTERMCLRSGAWEIIGLQVERYRSAAVAYGDRIYVLGGYFRRHRNYQPPRSVQYVSSAVTYITASGAFGRTADMPVPRAGHGAFVSANQIVVLGGSLLARRRASGGPSTDNEAADRFDVASGTWHQLDVDREDPDVAGWLGDGLGGLPFGALGAPDGLPFGLVA